MRWRILAATLLLAPVVTPSIDAGTPEKPELTDPAGDVSGEAGLPDVEPWAGVVDLLAFWITQDGDALTWHWQFADFSQLRTGELVDAPQGRVIYAYTSFDVAAPNETFGKYHDSLYFDDVSSPASQPGWRFELEEGRVKLNGTVDVAASRVEVRVPVRALNGAPPGSVISNLSVQAITTSNTDARAADLAPDRGPCGACAFVTEGAAPGLPDPQPQGKTANPEQRATPDVSAPVILAIAAMVGWGFRRRG
jgi:hypothetical protein